MHKSNVSHCNITVPPGGQTVMSPSVTECYFLLSPCMFLFFLCDNLEMSSKSNMYFLCGCIYWKGSWKAKKKKKKNRMLQSGRFASMQYGDGILQTKCCFIYKKRVFLSLFCCKEERMYKLGLYHVVGAIPAFNPTNGEMLTAWMEKCLVFFNIGKCFVMAWVLSKLNWDHCLQMEVFWN